jgi:hypothetical protein
MLKLSISYPDLIEFGYFANLIKRGDRGGVKGGPKIRRVYRKPYLSKAIRRSKLVT